jgi:hypothetical protein
VLSLISVHRIIEVLTMSSFPRQDQAEIKKNRGDKGESFGDSLLRENGEVSEPDGHLIFGH